MDAPAPNGIWEQGANVFSVKKKTLIVSKVSLWCFSGPMGQTRP